MSALAAAEARAAVVLDDARSQTSATDVDRLSDVIISVGNTPNRLLVFGVSIAGSTTTVSSISWRGQAATPVVGLSSSAGFRSCRVEIWSLVDPNPGLGSVSVQLSGTAAFGLGVALYSGVDRQQPLSNERTATGSSSPVSLEAPSTDGRPFLGVVCLGGLWTGGRTGGNGPDAVVPSIDTSLWDFTENNVVGLGSHSPAFNGIARVRWDITFAGQFNWLAAGYTITPAGGVDAGVDAQVMPDAAPDTQGDAAPDASAEVPPAAPEAGLELSADSAAPDLAGPDVDPGEDAASDAVNPMSSDADRSPEDAAIDEPTAEVDGGTTIHDADFKIGCACRTGGRGGGSALPLVLAALVARWRRPARR